MIEAECGFCGEIQNTFSQDLDKPNADYVTTVCGGCGAAFNYSIIWIQQEDKNTETPVLNEDNCLIEAKPIQTPQKDDK